MDVASPGATLSTQFVRRQIRARQFSADIIDKVGERHLEVRVPIPRDVAVRKSVSNAVREIVEGLTKARAAIRHLLTSDLRMNPPARRSLYTAFD